MKKFDSNQPVLVTGGTGYLASWIVRYLMEQGTPVHVTVRNLKDKKKHAFLLDMAEELNASMKLFEADLLDEGSFAEAMKGCSIVFHTASPFLIGNIKNPDAELIRPAEQGTANVLNEASRSEQVQRVVLTSSVAAMYGDSIDLQNVPNQTMDESFWNTTSSTTHQPYSFSKMLAERKAWKMAEESKKWDLVVMNPSFIFGPSLNKRTTGASTSIILQIAKGDLKMGAPDFWYGMVDVRDVAKAHLAGAYNPEASGRHILRAGHGNFLDVANWLRENYRQYPLPKKLMPKALFWLVGPMFGLKRKMISRNYGYRYQLDNSYSLKDLGLSYRPLKETMNDHFEQLIRDEMIK